MNGSNTPKIAVVGNCQAGAVAACLCALLPGAVVDTFQFGAITITAEELQSRLPEYDVAAVQNWVQDSMLASVRVSDLCRTVVPFEPVVFEGFHPDIVSVHHGGEAIAGPLDIYHSGIIAASYSLDLEPSRVPKLFNSLVYAKLGYLDGFTEAKAEFLRMHRQAGFDLSRHFERWVARGSFMHTTNHPTIDSLATIAWLIAVRAGLLDEDSVLPDNLPEELDGVQWPVYPEIARRLGFAGSLKFVRHPLDLAEGETRVIELSELVNRFYAVYASVPGLQLNSMSIVFIRDQLRSLLSMRSQ